jgi:hypothetical protein
VTLVALRKIEGKTDQELNTDTFTGEDADLVNFVSRTFGVALLATVLGVVLVPAGPGPAGAVEVGEPAPAFNLAATTGGDISLNDFRGKKWVLLEFYGADFAPT